MEAWDAGPQLLPRASVPLTTVVAQWWKRLSLYFPQKMPTLQFSTRMPPLLSAMAIGVRSEVLLPILLKVNALMSEPSETLEKRIPYV